MSLEEFCESTISSAGSRRRSSDDVYVDIERHGGKRRCHRVAAEEAAEETTTTIITEEPTTQAVGKLQAGEALVVGWAQGLAKTGRIAKGEEMRLVCELAGIEQQTVCQLVSSLVGVSLRNGDHASDSDSWQAVCDPRALESATRMMLADPSSNELVEAVSAMSDGLSKYVRTHGADSDTGRENSRCEPSSTVEDGSGNGTVIDDNVGTSKDGDGDSSALSHPDASGNSSPTRSSGRTNKNCRRKRSISSISSSNTATTNINSKAKSSSRKRRTSAKVRVNNTPAPEITPVRMEEFTPEMMAIADKDFEPMAVQRTKALPAHSVVCVRKGSQKQGMHEYKINGYPVPMDPELWLAQAKAVYSGPGVEVINRMQTSTCLVERVMGLYMCNGCMRRQAEDVCRFTNIRVITEVNFGGSTKANSPRFLLTPTLMSSPDIRPHPVVVSALGTTSEVLRKGGNAQWEEFYMIHTAAIGLVSDLDRELSVVAAEKPHHGGEIEYGVHPQLGCSAAPCVLRRTVGGSRQLCDTCASSILCAYYMCSMCAMEVCIRCFGEWNDSSIGGRVAAGKSNYESGLPRIARCKRIRPHGGSGQLSAKHRRSQFVRMSVVAPDDVLSVAAKTRAVLALGGTIGKAELFDCSGAGGASAEFDARIASIQQRAGDLEEWELAPVYVDADELSLSDFSRLWRRGVVIVVRGLLPAMESELWRPEWWIRHAGFQDVSVWDCAKGTALPDTWPLRDFFRLFDGDDTYAHLFASDSGDGEESGSGNSGNSNGKDDGTSGGEPVPESVPEPAPEPAFEPSPGADAAVSPKERAASALWKKRARLVRNRILKLKDWPPSDDFASVLPDHFARMMEALPFPAYTRRDGRLNMAARLPSDHVPPDLGPKMYCAYASSDDAGGAGTTNLHCDAADAVNIMAYAAPLPASAPVDTSASASANASANASADADSFIVADTCASACAGVDSRADADAGNVVVADLPAAADANAVTGAGAATDAPANGGDGAGADLSAADDVPVCAAAWDIYPPSTAGALRAFIGNTTHGDPIHNQAAFLTRPDRQRLFRESGARCYRVHQNPGDAVFVPAGSAHQVVNYANAVKVAMDFVSPERISHCRRLAAEFRALPPSHPRSVDLLQLSSILWWALVNGKCD
ncbi:hypothetical protein LPJ72_003499 [Coemansia sp. Benny D160-2]|nr:hypothetical protein LPJ72_003499 [Coemansia sp. Benny D160-2]